MNKTVFFQQRNKIFFFFPTKETIHSQLAAIFERNYLLCRMTCVVSEGAQDSPLPSAKVCTCIRYPSQVRQLLQILVLYPCLAISPSYVGLGPFLVRKITVVCILF